MYKDPMIGCARCAKNESFYPFYDTGHHQIFFCLAWDPARRVASPKCTYVIFMFRHRATPSRFKFWPKKYKSFHFDKRWPSGFAFATLSPTKWSDRKFKFSVVPLCLNVVQNWVPLSTTEWPVVETARARPWRSGPVGLTEWPVVRTLRGWLVTIDVWGARWML